MPLDTEASRELARELNRATWADLDTGAPDDATVDAAHASLHHWRAAGGPREIARGHWLISHVYALLGRGEPALYHAHASFALCEEHGFGDFDLAYGWEGLARATAAGGGDATEYLARAAESGAVIADPEDRAVFAKDLAAGPWYGAR